MAKKGKKMMKKLPMPVLAVAGVGIGAFALYKLKGKVGAKNYMELSY